MLSLSKALAGQLRPSMASLASLESPRQSRRESIDLRNRRQTLSDLISSFLRLKIAHGVVLRWYYIEVY
jgi:hypothetical protein